jgi:hypothetical protein
VGDHKDTTTNSTIPELGSNNFYVSIEAMSFEMPIRVSKNIVSNTS